MSVDDSCGVSLVLGEEDSKPERSQRGDAPGARDGFSGDRMELGPK